YVATARPLIAEIHARGKLPCVVGGTGLYIRALLGGLAALPTGDESLRQALHQQEMDQGTGTLHRELERIDPQAARKIHPHNVIRLVRALEVCRLTGEKFSAIKATHDLPASMQKSS
ncbi:MAG: tRNA dimethylallyltransferase, partial [Desulfuromonadaceae bacterium]